MFNIEEELKKLPDKPGVYIMHDANDNIIYVGKAISLKKRVRQYFRKNNKTKSIENMVSLVNYFEYIVTDNEAEALILECNLIKKNMPKFNVLLKDDKTYPYIKVNVKDDYPNVYLTRRILNDGAKYFGPYASAGSAKETIEFIKSKFKIRQCRNFKYKNRPCLNYHIHKCYAPCMGYISKEEYRKQINEIIDILEGRKENLLKQINKELIEASNNLEYEKAADLRDKKIAIERISQKQKVSNISENDIDVIGIAKSKIQICIEIFYIRKSKMIDRKHYFFSDLQDETNEQILSDFIKQYYLSKNILPNKIMLKYEIQDKEVLQELLSKNAGRKVEIKTPQKGEKLRLVDMAQNNAKITLENKEKNKYNILAELKEVLKLEQLPRRIECYDISNIGNSFMTAGMCVLKDGEIHRELSRRFKIKTVLSQDDPRCMQEVLTRRIKHTLDNKKGLGDLPDVIFIDGGITQMKSAKKVIDSLNVNIPIFGMVKDDKHTTRALIDFNRKELEISQDLKNLITRFQDEVHDTAINYHRKLRDKSMSSSILDEIEGIGDVKKQELLKKFGSIDKIMEAEPEEISEIKGITIKKAKEIKNILNNEI